jgi:hypothetical protein
MRMPTNPPPNRSHRELIFLIVLVVLLVAIVLRFYVGESLHGVSLPEMVCWWLIFLVSLYLEIVVHEFGHVIGARLGRLTVLAIDLVFFRIRRKASGDGFRIVRLEREPGYPFAAVWAAADGADPWRIAVLLLGGPAANFAVGFVCLFACWMTAGLPKNTTFFFGFAMWVALFGILNVGAAAGNLLPLSVGKLRSDGAQFLDLILRRWRLLKPPPGVSVTFVGPASSPVHLPQGIHYEFDAPEEVAVVEFPSPTCRPPDASIE